MTKATCARCGLSIDLKHKEGNQYTYSISKTHLTRCEVLREKVAESGEADVRFICPELEKAIQKATKGGKRLN